MSARDELARDLMVASACAWEKNGSRHWPNMADELIAKGYRKPRVLGYVVVSDADFLPSGEVHETRTAAQGVVDTLEAMVGQDRGYRVAEIVEAAS